MSDKPPYYPLKLGQRIRASTGKLDSGKPTREADLSWSSIDGVITAMKNRENSLEISIQTDSRRIEKFYITVSVFGPRLCELDRRVEILCQPPEQESLLDRRSAA